MMVRKCKVRAENGYMLDIDDHSYENIDTVVWREHAKPYNSIPLISPLPNPLVKNKGQIK